MQKYFSANIGTEIMENNRNESLQIVKNNLEKNRQIVVNVENASIQ